LILQMPKGFNPSAANGIAGDLQFDLSGAGGGKLFLSIGGGQCTAHEGASVAPLLTIKAPGEVWLRLARGELDRPKALMEGLYSVDGDMALLMKMGEIFHAQAASGAATQPASQGAENKSQKREGGIMKILAVQGSPRPRMSNTEVLLREFLKGAESEGAVAETVYLKEKKIHSCQGCYTCWTKTPGTCVFKDDMPELLEKVKACDVIVYATPLYCYNVTALLKTFQERLLPLLDPHLVRKGDAYHHPKRYPGEMKMVLVSNCGFPDISQFDALKAVFGQMERQGHGPLVGRVLMPAGELLKQDAFRTKAQPVLDGAYQAGVELARDGRVSPETEAIIQTPIVPADDMADMANLSWDSLIETKGSALTPGRVRDMRLLLKGMAATLNPKAAGDLRAVIQFRVTGTQPGGWYLSIEKGACAMAEGEADSPSLTITTPSDVWLAVANRELDGQTAFMEGKYTVQGDMALLMRMKILFGG
jgi:multimeric flavodoxin WrbA/putative sterol carrier protein